jgi:hypothetical protein
VIEWKKGSNERFEKVPAERDNTLATAALLGGLGLGAAALYLGLRKSGMAAEQAKAAIEAIDPATIEPKTRVQLTESQRSRPRFTGSDYASDLRANIQGAAVRRGSGDVRFNPLADPAYGMRIKKAKSSDELIAILGDMQNDTKNVIPDQTIQAMRNYIGQTMGAMEVVRLPGGNGPDGAPDEVLPYPGAIIEVQSPVEGEKPRVFRATENGYELLDQEAYRKAVENALQGQLGREGKDVRQVVLGSDPWNESEMPGQEGGGIKQPKAKAGKAYFNRTEPTWQENLEYFGPQFSVSYAERGASSELDVPVPDSFYKEREREEPNTSSLQSDPLGYLNEELPTGQSNRSFDYVTLRGESRVEQAPMLVPGTDQVAIDPNSGKVMTYPVVTPGAPMKFQRFGDLPEDAQGMYVRLPLASGSGYRMVPVRDLDPATPLGQVEQLYKTAFDGLGAVDAGPEFTKQEPPVYVIQNGVAERRNPEEGAYKNTSVHTVNRKVPGQPPQLSAEYTPIGSLQQSGILKEPQQNRITLAYRLLRKQVEKDPSLRQDNERFDGLFQGVIDGLGLNRGEALQGFQDIQSTKARMAISGGRPRPTNPEGTGGSTVHGENIFGRWGEKLVGGLISQPSLAPREIMLGVLSKNPKIQQKVVKNYLRETPRLAELAKANLGGLETAEQTSLIGQAVADAVVDFRVAVEEGLKSGNPEVAAAAQRVYAAGDKNTTAFDEYLKAYVPKHVAFNRALERKSDPASPVPIGISDATTQLLQAKGVVAGDGLIGELNRVLGQDDDIGTAVGRLIAVDQGVGYGLEHGSYGVPERTATTSGWLLENNLFINSNRVNQPGSPQSRIGALKQKIGELGVAAYDPSNRTPGVPTRTIRLLLGANDDIAATFDPAEGLNLANSSIDPMIARTELEDPRYTGQIARRVTRYDEKGQVIGENEVSIPPENRLLKGRQDMLVAARRRLNDPSLTPAQKEQHIQNAARIEAENAQLQLIINSTPAERAASTRMANSNYMIGINEGGKVGIVEQDPYRGTMYLDEGDSPNEMISIDRQADIARQSPVIEDADAVSPEVLAAAEGQSGGGSRSELDRLRGRGQELLSRLGETEFAKVNEQVKALRAEARQRKEDYRGQVQNPGQPTMPVRVITGEPAGPLKGRSVPSEKPGLPAVRFTMDDPVVRSLEFGDAMQVPSRSSFLGVGLGEPGMSPEDSRAAAALAGYRPRLTPEAVAAGYQQEASMLRNAGVETARVPYRIEGNSRIEGARRQRVEDLLLAAARENIRTPERVVRR